MPCCTKLLVEVCSFCYFGLIMARIPRRLQDLKLSLHDPEHVQLGEENLQGPPEIDNIVPGRSHESTSEIKIIWPNGETRQIVGEFWLKNLSQVARAKIIVETNEKGVPNERSCSKPNQKRVVAMHLYHMNM